MLRGAGLHTKFIPTDQENPIRYNFIWNIGASSSGTSTWINHGYISMIDQWGETYKQWILFYYFPQPQNYFVFNCSRIFICEENLTSKTG